MAKLIYAGITSLDGYIADENGDFDWGMPDEEVHAFVNDLERPIGTYLFGRRMYEVMVAWETMDLTDEPPVIVDYRGNLACGRQDRVFQDARVGLQRQDQDRARPSILRPSGGSRRRRPGTSRWAAPRSPPRRSGRGWSTSYI